MKNKFTIAVLVAFAILIIVVGLLFIQNKKLKEQKSVQEENVKELLAEKASHMALILTYSQAEAITSLKLDSLTTALQIKPKTVLKTVEKEVRVTDTIPKEVPVYILGRDKWFISDTDKCWSWSAIATVKGDSLDINRTNFNYHNKTTDIYYWERTKHFWFIKYGKKKTFVKTSSECGESYTREINIKGP